MANTIGTNASPGNTYADPGIYYDKRFLERLTPQVYLKSMADMKPLPQKSGTLVKWHRLNKLSPATTALTENTNPSESTVGTSVVTAEPLTYGSWVKVSTELNLKSINPIVEEIQDELADQAALTYDTLLRTALHGNVTNQFGGGAANEAAVTDASVFNASEIRRAVYSLRNSSVPGFEGNMYKGVISPAQQFDLFADTAVGSWLDIHKYTTPTPLMNGEIGQIYGTRWVVSPNLGGAVGPVTSFTGTGATDETYRGFLFGRAAFGATELAGHGVKTFREQGGGTSDPLHMFTTIGWKFMLAGKVLEAARAIELYTGSAAS